MVCGFILFRNIKTCFAILVKYKHSSTHWSGERKKTHAIDKALNHFDDFYENVFTRNWPAIRRGLLGKQKYVAIINNYSDVEETTRKLEENGALNVRRLFQLEKEHALENIDKRVWTSEVAEKPHVTEPTTERSTAAEVAVMDSDAYRLIDQSDVAATSMLHQFLPATKVKGKEDWILESDHYKYYESDPNATVQIEREYDIHFPDALQVFCYEQGNFSRFESPKRGSTGVYNYFLMDGASVLPILALDLRPGVRMLDMCAAPGGKTLLALQTLYLDYLVSNDVSWSRMNRIQAILEQYFYDADRDNRLKVTHGDGRCIEENNFDRILVDVPCTTDRHSVLENENNIFNPGRIKERLQLPELQCALLVRALKLVQKGGVVVYSTCSLSPIQNDGVVHMALKQIWEETKLEFVVKDLGPALTQVRSVFRLAASKLMKYGHLVVPFLDQNYGPMYFCKLERIK